MAPHLRDLLLGMAPPPEVQGGRIETSGCEVVVGNDPAGELRTVPGSGLGDPG